MDQVLLENRNSSEIVADCSGNHRIPAFTAIGPYSIMLSEDELAVLGAHQLHRGPRRQAFVLIV